VTENDTLLLLVSVVLALLLLTAGLHWVLSP
jgi:hypothetical protein